MKEKRRLLVRRLRRATDAPVIQRLDASVKACEAEVQDLKRMVTSLRAEIDHLRDKIRS
jgi:hypothetical protein